MSNGCRLPIVAMTGRSTVRSRAAAGTTASISRLRNYFLTGLILVGPVYITINLTWWFVNWVDDAGAAVHSGRPTGRRPICRSSVPGYRPDHRVRSR